MSHSIRILSVYIGAVRQVAASTSYLAIGSGRPLFQLAALGLGIRLQALAGGLRLLLMIWIILILPHLQATELVRTKRFKQRTFVV